MITTIKNPAWMLGVAFLMLAGCVSSNSANNIYSANELCVPADDPRADVNMDGVVDSGDLLVIRSGLNWGRRIECPPTPSPTPPPVTDPLRIDLTPTINTVTLTLPHQVYTISVPPSKTISNQTLIGDWTKTAVNVRGDTLILNCTIKNWQTGVGNGSPDAKVWIVNSIIEDCVDYGAYLPGTEIAVIGSQIRRIGGTCLRLPYYKNAVVYDTTIESSDRRLLIKAHNATRLGKPFSSGLWIQGCTFIGSSTQDYLCSVAPQNKDMTEDVRNATFYDCDFTFGPQTKIGLLFGGVGMKAEKCRFDAKQGVPTRWAIVGEQQGVSPYQPPTVINCTADGAPLER